MHAPVPHINHVNHHPRWETCFRLRLFHSRRGILDTSFLSLILIWLATSMSFSNTISQRPSSIRAEKVP
jgi:hypothetical protein